MATVLNRYIDVHNEDEQITQRKVRVITEMMRKGLEGIVRGKGGKK